MYRVVSLTALLFWQGCSMTDSQPAYSIVDYREKLNDYQPVRLEADLSGLSENQHKMLPLLIRASEIMDNLFWQQAFGDKQSLLDSIESPDARRFAEINYGPWDRLDGNTPFLEGFDPKPLAARFYPEDMNKQEFEQASEQNENLKSPYVLVLRNNEGQLVPVYYHEAYSEELNEAAAILREAATLADDDGFEKYLTLRADALTSSDYQPSDFAWMEMQDNAIDLVIGPIESYEDRLFGTKTAFEAYVLIKDKEWSNRLKKYSTMLPSMQEGLPVPAEYKSEEPGSESQLNAYEVIYYAGDCNAGAKTIAINLPNDEEVHLAKGSRRLQLKNAMRAKFDHILLPISELLIAEDQRNRINFDAFFANTMFHEVAHGLGIKNTLDGSGTVREALQDLTSALEEAKADILGLHLLGSLSDTGQLPSGELEDNYVTFLAGFFRSIRFGASSAHGIANTLSFNFFKQHEAFSRDSDSGVYRVNPNKMKFAVDALSEKIIRLQGDGNYELAKAFIDEFGASGEQLRLDLAQIERTDIPVDIVFEQGLEVN